MHTKVKHEMRQKFKHEMRPCWQHKISMFLHAYVN